MSPNFYVQHEVQIPDGAMFIPENAREMAMLLDKTTAGQRGAVVAGCSLALLGLAQLLVWIQT